MKNIYNIGNGVFGKIRNKNGYLYLNNQGITTNDGIIIGELLKTNNTLKKLGLYNNNITDVQSIGEGLKTNNTLTTCT